MSNTLLIKRSSTPGAAPGVGNLALGELAINTYDGRLYTKVDTGTANVFELTQNQPIQVLGNVTGNSVNTGNGTSNITLTLTTTGVTAGTYGGSTGPTSNIGVFTVDQYGRITSATNVAISTSSLSNGTSNIQIANSGNVAITVAGTPNVAVFANTGVYVTGVTSASGNITGANLLTSGVVSATGNITGNNIQTAGVVTATGNITGGNIATAGNIAANGVLTDNYYYANGLPVDFQQAAGSNGEIQFNLGDDFAASANLAFDNANSIFTVIGTANVTGNITSGNLSSGGQLAVTGNANIGNIGTAGLITATGNITGGNINTAGKVTATGNVTGGNIVTAGQVSAAGNISGNNVIAVNAVVGNIDVGNIQVTGNIVVNSVTANTFVSAVGNVIGGNLITGGNIVGTFVAPAANTYVMFNDAGVISGNVGFTFDKLGNVLTVGAATGTLKVADIQTPQAGVSLRLIPASGVSRSYGNFVPQFGNTYNLGSLSERWQTFYANISDTIQLTAAGNITGGNVLTGGIVSATGNVTGGNVTTAGQVIATANITGGNIIANALLQGVTVSASGNAIAGNVNTGGIVSATGNVTGGNLITAGLATVTGNITGGNVSTAGQVSATGNVTGGNVNTLGLVSAGSASVTGNVTSGNVLTGGVVSATGNITGGNVATAGQVTAGGNVTGANFATAGLITATGNVTGGNIVTPGSAVVTGNVSANNAAITNLMTAGQISTAGNVLAGQQVSAAGNVTGGNIATAGLATVTGNVTAGNFNTAGVITATGNITGGNINTAGVVTTGNINSAAALSITTANGDINLWPTSGNVNLANVYINNLASPAQAFDAATKQYVDDAVSTGIVIHTPVYVESPTALAATYAQGGTTHTVTNITGNTTLTFSSTHSLNVNDQIYWTSSFNGITANTSYFVYSVPANTQITLSNIYGGPQITNLTNGTGLSQVGRANPGVGATLTANVNGAVVIDGVTLTAGQRVLIYTQTNAAHNGVYTVTNTGNVSAPWVLTRSTDTNTYAPSSINGLDAGDYFFVQAGDTGAGESYVLTAPTGELILGYDNLTFTQFSASQVYSAGNGLTLTGTVFSVNTDNDTTAIVGGNVVVKASANLVTPNIGAATGTSLSVTGNITGANVISSGLITVTGNILSGNVSAVGNVTASANVNANNATITANVVSGNIITSGIVSATGNITGGNLVTSATANVGTLIVNTFANILATTISVSNVTGALRVAGGIGVTGNVYADGMYVLGDAVLTVNSTIDGGTY